MNHFALLKHDCPSETKVKSVSKSRIIQRNMRKYNCFRNNEHGAHEDHHRIGKRRIKSGSEKEGGGKMYLIAGLVSILAVCYFVYQVPAQDYINVV